jgi:NADH-ubiquinone oxidoreductase chain 6
MLYLYINNSVFSYNILILLQLFIILLAIFVIISKNPVVSVLFLIGLFLSVAIYLIIIGLTFVGLSYLLVYIGAVSILFLFILMLIDIRVSELQTDTNNSIFLGTLIGVLFYYAISNKLYADNLLLINNIEENNNNLRFSSYNS